MFLGGTWTVKGLVIVTVRGTCKGHVITIGGEALRSFYAAQFCLLFCCLQIFFKAIFQEYHQSIR